MIFLDKLSIYWIDGISFKAREISTFEVFTTSTPLNITFSGLIYFDMSNDQNNRDNSNGWDVVDVIHEYRKVKYCDLNSYAYKDNLLYSIDDKKLVSNRSDITEKKHIIHFEGDAVLNIICDDVIINEFKEALTKAGTCG